MLNSLRNRYFGHLIYPFVLCAVLLCNFSAQAKQIPGNLNRDEIDDVSRLLGFTTSTKLLSQPYPLGGFSGLEFGVSQHFIDVQELSALGDGTATEDTFSYSQVSVGKGLYNDIDLYMHFVPFSRANQVSEYGVLLKWGYFEASYLPLSLALLVHINSINIEDNFINQSSGFDLLAAINTETISLYFGLGRVRARSQFKSTVLDTSDPIFSGSEYKESYSSMHSFVGISAEFYKFFLVGQIDRYKDPVYSFKVGMRL